MSNVILKTAFISFHPSVYPSTLFDTLVNKNVASILKLVYTSPVVLGTADDIPVTVVVGFFTFQYGKVFNEDCVDIFYLGNTSVIAVLLCSWDGF